MGSITYSDLPALKKAYQTAIKANIGTFPFKGGRLLVYYAHYLIEYLESKAKP